MSLTSGSGDIVSDVYVHLLAAGHFRAPGTTAAGLHPLWRDPELGAIAPGEKQGAAADADAVVSMRQGTEIAVGAYESWYKKPVVEFIYRVRKAPLGPQLDDLIRGEFEERRAWVTSGGLQVIESGIWRRLAKLGQDEVAFTFLSAFYFQIYSGRGPRVG